MQRGQVMSVTGTHEVSIVWGTDKAPDYIVVVENQPWTIDGRGWGDRLYTDQHEYTYDSYILMVPTGIRVPEVPTRTGYVFLGLYSSDIGGVQYTNAAGYGIRPVISDMTLYALWQEAE